MLYITDAGGGQGGGGKQSGPVLTACKIPKKHNYIDLTYPVTSYPPPSTHTHKALGISTIRSLGVLNADLINVMLFLEDDLFYSNKSTNNYLNILQNLYTHTNEMQHIIYMQEASGQLHIDQYRSKLYSLYTSNDGL